MVGLDVLPLARVVNDEKVTDHHAIIPTRSEHNLEKMGSDDLRIYDMAVRRFLAVFHPEAVFENTRVETTVTASDGETAHVFRTRGKLLQVPGWRGVYDEIAADAKARGEERGEDDEETDQQLPRLLQDEQVQTREVESARKETKPPRRYSDASLLGAMETAGKLVDDDELREAMKDSGIGTPATRAAMIERLITVGYIERDGRALVATEKGLNVIRLLDEHALTSPGLTGSWEQRLGKIERGEDSRKQFMRDIAGFAQETVKELDETLKDVRIPRARLGPVPGVRPRDRGEPQGLLLLGARRRRLRLRDLEGQSRQDAAVGGRQGADQDRLHRAGGDRLSRAQRAQLPRAPRSAADRRGQMARGVRRAVGQGGRQSPRGRGGGGHRSLHCRCLESG